MKRTLVGGSFALACTAAIAPLAMTAAHAQGAAPAQTTSVQSAAHTIAFQSADQMAALKAAAQDDTASMVSALGLSADNTFTVHNVVKDADGATHTHVNRLFKGIPVLHGDLVVHRDAAGKVTGHDGTFDGPITVDTTPKLSLAQAKTHGLAAAKSFAEAKDGGLKDETAGAAGLVIYVAEDGSQHLASQTQTNGFADDNTPSRIHSVISADSGSTLQTFDRIAHANGTGHGLFIGTVTLPTTQTGSGYEMRNPDNGNYATDSHNKKIDGDIFTSATNTWGNGKNSDRSSAGVDAEFGADKTFDFYKQVMGRNGIWDNGKGTRSRVHYDHNYVNAFWDSQQMTYGDGDGDAHPLTEIDVSAHEMTHGVTENTANLDYEGDAGGLNEATSDIEGTAVEWYANLATDKPDYLIGEMIDLNGDGSPLRYMDKPSKDGMSPDCWSTAVKGLDPHEGSGPLNHWFYLASEGSGAKTVNGVAYNSPTCNGKAVTGAGRDVAERVWYATLTNELTSRAKYADAREGAIRQAKALYGKGSTQCASIAAAFDGIAVPAGTQTCSN